MILYPLDSSAPNTQVCQPVWDAILRSQKQAANAWQLVTQADHAALAGEMARNLKNPDFPNLHTEIISAIAVHDDGWKEVDDPISPKVNRQGRPLSFFEESPANIFRAWGGSIAAATQIAPIAGILVSEHFCRIARDFSRSPTTPPEVVQALTTFVEREIAQQEDLRGQQSRSDGEIRVLVDVLQFFDLLSLYICCGSQENVAFPQRFNGKAFCLYREAGNCRVDPSIFAAPTRLTIRSWKFSQSGTSQPVDISVLVS
jgi:hypothetical protein